MQISSKHPSPARLMAPVSLLDQRAGAFARGFGPGLFLFSHRSVRSTARSSMESFCRLFASFVNVLRRKASSAARAGSFDVFAMPALSAVCHW